MSIAPELDPTNAIGMTVDIAFERSRTKIRGNIFTVIKEANILVLMSKENDVLFSNLINISEIKSITLAKEQVDVNTEELMKVNLNEVVLNERRNLSKDILIKKAETEPNFEKGLNIYEALSKLYHCSYDGKRIVLDEVDAFIEAPFHLNNLHCEDEENLKRLSRIVQTALKMKK